MPGYVESEGKRKSADGFFYRSQQIDRFIESETQPCLDELRSNVSVGVEEGEAIDPIPYADHEGGLFCDHSVPELVPTLKKYRKSREFLSR